MKKIIILIMCLAVMISCSNHDTICLESPLVFYGQNSNEVIRLEKETPFMWYDSIYFIANTTVDCKVMRNDTLDILLIEETIQDVIPSFKRILYYQGDVYYQGEYKMYFIDKKPYVSKGISISTEDSCISSCILDNLYESIYIGGINYQSCVDSNAFVRFISDSVGKVVCIDDLFFTNLSESLNSDYYCNYYEYGKDTIVILVTFIGYPGIDNMIIPFYYFDSWDIVDIIIESDGKYYFPYCFEDEEKMRKKISSLIYPVLDGILMKNSR